MLRPAVEVPEPSGLERTDDGGWGRVPAVAAEFGKAVGWGIGSVAGMLTLLTLGGWLSDNTSLLCSAGLVWMAFFYIGVMLLKTVEDGLKSIAKGVAHLQPLIGGTGVDLLQTVVYLVGRPGAALMGLLAALMEMVPDVHVMLGLWSQPGSRFGLSDFLIMALPLATGIWAEFVDRATEDNQTWAWVATQMMATFSLCRGVVLLLCGYSGKEAL